LNKNGDKTEPCLTPKFTVNIADHASFHCSQRTNFQIPEVRLVCYMMVRCSVVLTWRLTQLEFVGICASRKNIFEGR